MNYSQRYTLPKSGTFSFGCYWNSWHFQDKHLGFIQLVSFSAKALFLQRLGCLFVTYKVSKTIVWEVYNNKAYLLKRILHT